MTTFQRSLLVLFVTFLAAQVAFADDFGVYGSDCNGPGDPACGDLDLESRACFKEIFKAKSEKTKENFEKLAACQKLGIASASKKVVCEGNSKKTKNLSLVINLDTRDFVFSNGKDLSAAGEFDKCSKPTRMNGQHKITCSAEHVQTGALKTGTKMGNARVQLSANFNYTVGKNPVIFNTTGVKDAKMKCSAKTLKPLFR